VIIDPETNSIIAVLDEDDGLDSEPIGEMISVGNNIYIPTLSGMVNILDTNTNIIIDGVILPDIDGGTHKKSLKYDNFIYIIDTNSFYIINTLTNILVRTIQFDSSVDIMPVIIDDSLYLIGGSDIIEIDLNTNETITETNYGSDTVIGSSSYAIYDGNIYVAGTFNSEANVFVIDIENNQIYNCRGYESDNESASPSNTSTSSSGTVFGCRDKNATNYSSLARHKQDTCQYGPAAPELKESEDSCPIIKGYHFLGETDPEIILIQSFLSSQGFYNGLTNGVFDKLTDDAVKKFQTKYTSEVLKPWGLKRATGWWYKTTSKKANELLGCQVGEIEIKID